MNDVYNASERIAQHPNPTETKERQSPEPSKREPSNYLPQCDLPMPVHEFQVPNQSLGGCYTPSGSNSAPQEPASPRNFSVRRRLTRLNGANPHNPQPRGHEITGQTE